MVLRARPSSPVDGGLDFKATFASRLEAAGSPRDGPSATILVAPLVEVEHFDRRRVADLSLYADLCARGRTLANVQRFSMIGSGSQVGTRRAPRDDRPRLEYRPTAGQPFVTVPDHRQRAPRSPSTSGPSG